MATHKTLAGKIFGWIGDIFKSSAEKIWDSLSDEEQQNLIHGSGVVDIINKHLTDVPTVVKEAIQTEFPDLDINAIQIALTNFAQSVGIQTDGTFEGAISAVQTWLGTKAGTFWDWGSSSLAEFIGIVLSPATIYGKIGMVIELVYRRYVKK